MGYIEDLRNIVGNQPLLLVGVAWAVIKKQVNFYYKNEEIVFGEFLGD